MRRTLNLLLGLVLFGVIVAGGTAMWGYFVFTGPGPLPGPVNLVVPAGAGLRPIAAQLETAGVIRNPFVFIVAARLRNLHGSLKAGEYAFDVSVSQEAVLDKLVRHDTVVRRITIPEGLTSVEILTLLEETDGLDGVIESLPDEGALLPETYHFAYGDARADILVRMESEMSQALDELWRVRMEGLPFSSKEEALTLAAIVEKETSVPEERPRIAAVFINRLQRKMRLQSDSTVVYALTGGLCPLGRDLTRLDLKTDHPYNTYEYPGLPPGPISNPGRASIEAVLNPLITDELYFVADGTGGHAFAKSLQEHNRNVARWRRLRKQSSD